jgi:hypothetical protein
VATGGNRRSIGFHSFSETEYQFGDSSSASPEIADRFDNVNIYIAIDGDGDNEVTVPNADGSGTSDIKTQVTAYTLADADENPDYYLY